MFSRDGAGEEEALLRHDPELAAQRLLADVAQVDAVDRDRPARRVVEAREQLRDRRLAGAGMADERDRRARRHVEVDPVEHLGAASRSEKRTASKRTRPRDAAEVARAVAVANLGLLVEHVHDLVERRDRGEERVVELRELLHGVEEVREVAEERDEDADRDVAVEDEVAAVAEHDRRGDRREEVDEREVEAVQHDRLLVRRAR